MTMQTRIGGEWITISGGKIFAGGTWHDLVAVKIYAGGAWRDGANFTPSSGGSGGGGTIALSISPSPFGKNSHTSFTMTAPEVIATPSGGLAPYTYAWTVLSSDPSLSGVTINSPAAASTTVTASTFSSGDTAIQCVATDSLGVTTSASVTGTFSFVDF